MNNVKTQNDVDDALESTAGVIVDIDTVAIYFKNAGVCGLYGVYVKEKDLFWHLKMTTIRLEMLVQ